MRAPRDVPRRRPRPSAPRVWLLVAVAVVVVLLVSLRGIAGFYTDYLWFQSLGLSPVWRGVLGAKVGLAALFTVVFFALAWVNLLIADRVAPPLRPPGPEEEIVERYRQAVGGRTGLVRVGVAGFFALVAGIGTSAQWNEWILFTHRQSFGRRDPLFHRDVGFYVFELPFLKFLVDWGFAAAVIILLLTAAAHYLNGGIRVQVPVAQRVTPQVKAHLSVLLGALALLKAAGYWLGRYQLTFSTRGIVDGANYTDVKAQLPALYLLVAISVFAGGLFLFNIFRRGWALPVIAVGLWAFTSVIVGGAYPAFVQRFRVEPNQSTRELPYIQRNIDATRYALGLDKVRVRDFAYNEGLTAEDLAANAPTIRNVRLWDPSILRTTYAQQQALRKFYRFNDVDVDRYVIGGEPTQVMVSARELDLGGLLNKSWVNTHLNFTHGYGIVLSPANAATSEGLPAYEVKDLPPTGTPSVKQPALYFGEELGGYAIVGTKQAEISYQTADGRTFRENYRGEGGVPVKGLLRRAAFALRFGDQNVLISGFITPESKALYIRDIRERVKKAAPFLHLDGDPYPVVLDSHDTVLWIVDAYTTTSRYPYAQRAVTDRATERSGLRHRFNYVRNSVKVVVDAYHGTMRFYVVDPTDPVLRAYRDAFPALFDAGDPPAELRAHFRYPEDLFRIQTDMYGLYHITRAADFYDRGDAWDIARDPGSGTVVTATTPTTAATPAANAPPPREKLMDPYYLLMRLPGDKEESFLILQPFTPASKNQLASFMVAHSDPDRYGQLEVFVMPRSLSIDGPTLVDGKINQEPSVSREITLLGSRGAGSKVLNGNLLVIPVENSLLYIRPLYVEAEGNPIPELKKVVVVYGNRVVAGDTLRQALAGIFGQAPETREEAQGAPPPGGVPPGGPPVSSTVASLLDQALAAYQRAQEALRGGDLATYQREIDQMNRLVADARRQAAPEASPPTTGPAQA
jgi:uncharacterized membrane protein (UPF0182 family)